MRIQFLVILGLVCIGYGSIMAQGDKTDHVITFFIEKYPEVQPAPASPSMFSPERVFKSMAHHIVQNLGAQGIYALYGGYLAMSNQSGQITFPRKTQLPEFDLFVTNNLEPLLMAGTYNVRAWQLKKNHPAARYKVQRVEDGKVYYWQVSKAPLPKERNLPLHSIVVFAKPENIFVPLGITLTNDNPQFVLPTIYAKPQLNEVANAALLVNIKAFFSPVTFMEKRSEKSISQLIK